VRSDPGSRGQKHNSHTLRQPGRIEPQFLPLERHPGRQERIL
jgi:hypothetical protein